MREKIDTSCYHCGESCAAKPVLYDDKPFCCEGCKVVYNILNENELCHYYDLNEASGVSFKGRSMDRYQFLEDDELQTKLIDFSEGSVSKTHFYLPQIHCSSCLWLLENLGRLNEGILHSRVNFMQKEIYLQYSEELTSLREVVELLASLGYAPVLRLNQLVEDKLPVSDRSLYYKLGLAGFAFGNIMLFSFPEYLGLDKSSEGNFVRLFSYLNFGLILPVVFYSGSDYFRSAWAGLKQGHLNIDVPISLGILALFGRSSFDIISQSGPGYLDSLAGLLFFLLVGKWFQQKSFYLISFERDYKSYFPISTTKKEGKIEKPVALNQIQTGDRLIIRHGELIPTDSILKEGIAEIDYSFVTGESDVVFKNVGEKLFAGGRQKGGLLELEVSRVVGQSYLTQLWNDSVFSKAYQKGDTSEIATVVAKYFTIAILSIAVLTLLYWYQIDSKIAISAFTSVLIVACPCAVALSIPFTFGNVLRVLGNRSFYLKNIYVIEKLANIKHIVLDKTGTITNTGNLRESDFVFNHLSKEERYRVQCLAKQSMHPVSQLIAKGLEEYSDLPVLEFEEYEGKGIRGRVENDVIHIGSLNFVDPDAISEYKHQGTYISINTCIKACLQNEGRFRRGLSGFLENLRKKYAFTVLTGDHDKEKSQLATYFGDDVLMYFNQSPKDKMAYIRQLQEKNIETMMMGDGLNDAGALKQSNVGVVLTENTSNFTPACDAILDAQRFSELPVFLRFVRLSIPLVYASYVLALVYNVIGLSYAIQGLLSPVIAAILMPLSSVSIVLFGIGSSSLLARYLGLYDIKQKETKDLF